MAGLWEPVGGVYWSVPPPLVVPEEGWPIPAIVACALVAAVLAIMSLHIYRKRKEPEWQLRKHMLQLGGVATLVYLFSFLALVWDRLGSLLSMPLNELGDFCAGAFGPVGFLWLVLGYLQQAEGLRLSTKALSIQATELQQSTQALKLQAQELKNSVEQQTIMAAAATKQIEAQQQALQLQIEDREQLLVADFSMEVANSVPSESDDETMPYALTLSNQGQDAWNVRINFDDIVKGGKNVSLGSIKAGGSKNFSVRFPIVGDGVKGTCQVYYGDKYGNGRTQSFTYLCSPLDYVLIIDRVRVLPLIPPMFVTASIVED